MKKIIFIRHAKAEDPSNEISDFHRSLTAKGKMVSKHMAQKLREKEGSIGKIISSTAFRALETAIIFAQELGLDPERILLRSELYYKMNFKSLHESLNLLKEEEDMVTFVGHNPALTEIANMLCKEGAGFMPKTGIIGISFLVSTWSEIGYNDGHIEYFLKPDKQL